MKKFLTLLSLLASLSLVGACTPRMAGHLVAGAIVGAAVVGSAAVAAEHRSHFHHHNCGCHRHWDGGHWVYYYEGGYEYWDPQAGVWYRYR